jgi:peptidoglycan/xylan/chitin deacetylase (PgdA/CDA1 family)
MRNRIWARGQAGMRQGRAFALTGALLLVSFRATAAEPSGSFHWPGGAKAAVSLAYDDALDSQLDNAIPALDRYKLKGSFYLQLSSPSVARRMAQWQAVAMNDHELGNHTLFHQCAHSLPDREWVRPHRDLDTTTVDQMKDQVALANTMLYAIDGRRERTFTIPCGDFKAAGKNYLPSIKAEFVAIKGGLGTGIAESMTTLDPYMVPVLPPVDMTGTQLIALVKAAGAKGTMVNFTFHGVGGDYLSISTEAHEELVKFLAENRNVYWTDTFLNIMKYVKAGKARK